jgi:hypothetical protein
MTTEHRETQEEKAYRLLVEEAREVLSQPAGTIISEAESVAYGDNLIRTYALQPEEYDEAMEKMRLAAAEIADRDQELLARLWHAALAVAASIDPEDDGPVAYYKARRGDFHWYYRMLSGMVERTLTAQQVAEMRRAAKQEPDDFEDIEF